MVSAETSKLVEDERAGDGDVEGHTHSHHRDLDDLVQIGPDLLRQSRVFVAKEDDAASPGLGNLAQGDRLLVQLDPDDPGPFALLSLDPGDL